MIANLFACVGLVALIGSSPLQLKESPRYANYETSYTNKFKNVDSIDIDESYALFSDGYKWTLPAYTRNADDETIYSDYLLWATNYVANNTSKTNLIGFVYATSSAFVLISTNNVNYWLINAEGGTGTAYAYKCVSSTDLTDLGTAINNYPSYNPNANFNSFTYGYYQKSLASDSYCVFDYSSLYYSGAPYYYDTYRNITGYEFYYIALELTINGGYINLEYGANNNKDGYEQGYYNGYQNGSEEGYNNGYSDGNRDGHQSGYIEGYTEADNQDAVAVSIFTGIISIALIPINFFLACLNFEVFGINIGAFVSALLTVAIVVIITRMIVSGGNGGGDK